MGTTRFLVTLAASALGCALAAGCGQDGVTLPEESGSGDVGECGSWYPGGGDAGVAVDEDSDSDSSDESSYGIYAGDTLPCFVLDSVRSGAQVSDADPATYANAYLSMGEIYLKAQEPDMSALLQAQFGVTEAKAILFVFAADQCTACPKLMQGVTNSKEDLLAAGVIPIGAYSFKLGATDQTDAYDLVYADAHLIEDGFDPSLYRTNDPTHLLGDRYSFQDFPEMTIVRVSDMKVLMRGITEGYLTADGDNNPIIDVATVTALIESTP
jgi:hypothetical protein